MKHDLSHDPSVLAWCNFIEYFVYRNSTKNLPTDPDDMDVDSSKLATANGRRQSNSSEMQAYTDLHGSF